MDPTQLVGPAVLFVLMLVVGLELTLADFRRVLAAPRAVVGGTLAQLVLLPLMTWAVVDGLGVPPIFGAGAVLVAVSPGAGMSNIMVALAGANTALSVTLTAVTSILSVMTLPAIAALTMRLFLRDSLAIEVPVAPLVGQLALSLLLPIGIGMWVRARHPGFARRHARRLQQASAFVIVALIALAIAFSDGDAMTLEDAEAGLAAAAVWTALAMGIGWAVAAGLRLPPADRFTFLVEFSARNIAVATIVAISGLARLDLTFFSGAYAAVGYPMVVAAVLLRRRRGRARP